MAKWQIGTLVRVVIVVVRVRLWARDDMKWASVGLVEIGDLLAGQGDICKWSKSLYQGMGICDIDGGVVVVSTSTAPTTCAAWSQSWGRSLRSAVGLAHDIVTLGELPIATELGVFSRGDDGVKAFGELTSLNVHQASAIDLAASAKTTKSGLQNGAARAFFNTSHEHRLDGNAAHGVAGA